MKSLVIVSLLACALLTGCVSYSPSIPEGYTGPTARIKDTAEVHSSSKVDYFVVTKIDGKTIANSRIESISANQGRGFYMEPVVLARDVPARPLTLELQARTEYAAPILALTSTVYQVMGEITFTPVEGRTYQVKGVLSEQVAFVWLEDAETGEVIEKKIAPNGSAKLGFFQK